MQHILHSAVKKCGWSLEIRFNSLLGLAWAENRNLDCSSAIHGFSLLEFLLVFALNLIFYELWVRHTPVSEIKEKIPNLMGRDSFWMEQSTFYSLCLYEREQWSLFGRCVGTLSLKYTVKQSVTNVYLLTWGSLCCSQHFEVLSGAQGMICTECLHAGLLTQRKVLV